MDKDYSRVASRVAISQLLDEINILRDPLQAEERFMLLVSSQDIAQSFRREVEGASEELVELCFERIICLVMMENGGRVF